MMVRRRKLEPFCVDTANSLARDDKDFHWTAVYRGYLVLQEEEWRCAKRFNVKHYLVDVKEEGKSLASVTPLLFTWMLCLPKQTKIIRLPKANAFSDSQGGGINLWKEYLS